MRLEQNRVMVNTHTPRPRLTIAEAIREFDVSRATIKRGLYSGRYPEAAKDDDGMWRIPVESLHGEHSPRVMASVQSAVNPAHDLERRVMELESALAVAQAERTAAERVAEAEQRRAESAERALLMLESAPARSAPSAPEPSPVVAQRAPEPSDTPERTEVVEPFGRRLRRVFRPRG